MGRRALRKIDPNLDYSQHYLCLDDMEPPFSAAEYFPVSRPLEVEMGSGKGLFMDGAAADRPNHNFLGIEVSRKYAEYAAARFAKHEHDNARMIWGDGLRLFREFLATDSIHAVHVYFPDPWWKTRHHKRRIMNDSFLGDVQRVLQPGGRLHFWTDVKDYFDAALETIRAATDLIGPYDVTEKPAEHDLDFRTHFERRTRLNELPVYRCEFEKQAGN